MLGLDHLDGYGAQQSIAFVRRQGHFGQQPAHEVHSERRTVPGTRVGQSLGDPPDSSCRRGFRGGRRRPSSGTASPPLRTSPLVRAQPDAATPARSAPLAVRRKRRRRVSLRCGSRPDSKSWRSSNFTEAHVPRLEPTWSLSPPASNQPGSTPPLSAPSTNAVPPSSNSTPSSRSGSASPPTSSPRSSSPATRSCTTTSRRPTSTPTAARSRPTSTRTATARPSGTTSISSPIWKTRSAPLPQRATKPPSTRPTERPR